MRQALRSFSSSLLLTALAAAVFALPAMAEGPAVGQPAPEFTAKNLEGKAVKLSDLKGKIVVLEWTNPGCPFVQRQYSKAALGSLQKEYTDKGVVWLVINSTNKEHRDFREAAELKKVYEGWKSAYSDMLLDPEGALGKLYDARTTPHMFIIDAKGLLRYAGAIDDDPRGTKESGRINYVRLAIDALTAGKDVATTSTTPYGCSVKY